MCHAQEHTGGIPGGFCCWTSCFMACPGAFRGLVEQQLGQDASRHAPSPPSRVTSSETVARDSITMLPVI